MQLTLYTNPLSRGRIARWMLEEVGQPYEVENLAFGATMKAAAYTAVNPMGKVPALAHGDVVITETPAIIAYLADAFPAAGLAPPPSDTLRGAYYRWLFFAAGPLETAVLNRNLGVTVSAAQTAMAGYGSVDLVMDVTEAAITKHPFILGATFSAADVYLGSQIGFGLQFGWIEKRAAFVAYWDRLKDRPALLRAAALDDALAAT